MRWFPRGRVVYIGFDGSLRVFCSSLCPLVLHQGWWRPQQSKSLTAPHSCPPALIWTLRSLRMWGGSGRAAEGRLISSAGPGRQPQVLFTQQGGRADKTWRQMRFCLWEQKGLADPGQARRGVACAKGKVKCKECFLLARRPQTFVSSLQAVPPVIHNQRELINKPHLDLALQPGWDLGGSEVGGRGNREAEERPWEGLGVWDDAGHWAGSPLTSYGRTSGGVTSSHIPPWGLGRGATSQKQGTLRGWSFHLLPRRVVDESRWNFEIAGL